MSRAHWMDRTLSLLMARRRLFAGGWGDKAQIDRLSSNTAFGASPRALAIRWSSARASQRGVVMRDGTFSSPIAGLPDAARQGHVRALLPQKERFARPRPMYISLASSGDEGFAVRTRLFRALVAQEGIGVLLLENPLYGLRRPPGQKGSAIRTVSDHLLMNVAMVEEGLGLIESLAQEGHTRLGITGFSMGGSMAAMVAAVTRRPIAAAIFSAGRSAVYAFTTGLLSRSIDFEDLGRGEGGEAKARSKLGGLFALADLDRHPVPRYPDAAVIVGARRDGYVHPEEVQKLHDLWKGSQVRWLDTGHAGTMLQHAGALRRAALEAMERLYREVGA